MNAIENLQPALLLAQEETIKASTFFLPALLSIVIFICVIGAITASVFGLFRHEQRKRQLLHQERMEAIKSGLAWDDPEAAGAARHNRFWIAFWIVVCGCSIPFITIAANLESPFFQESANAIAAWLGAVCASVAACICATMLVAKSDLRSTQDRDRQPIGQIPAHHQ